jgi:4-hydroxybenzoate polyprenyltransferase
VPAADSPRAGLWDYARLCRVPNVFTALADVALGYLFAYGGWSPVGSFLWLACASASLYTAGMVLNDVYDVETDRRERPERPLPAGRIHVSSAARLGFVLLAAGVACGWIGGWTAPVPDTWWRCGVVASVLGAAVWAYDRVLKRTPIGPVVMGGCRCLNVLLGVSAGTAAAGGQAWLGYAPHELLAAGGLGVYVVGLSIMARREAETSRPAHLALGLMVLTVGLVLLGLVYGAIPAGWAVPVRSGFAWWLLVALLAFPVVRRAVGAVADPRPEPVQQAVRQGILSIIFLDAMESLLVSPPVYAVAILALLVPLLITGRWVYST